MRENRNFGERSRLSSKDRTRKKYFLVYEGSSTEEIYFNALNQLREEIHINPLIELVSLIRSYSEEGWSNPKKILQQLIQELEDSESGKLSYKALLDEIMEAILVKKEDTPEISQVSKAIIYDTLLRICCENKKITLSTYVEDLENTCLDILTAFAENFKLEKIVVILQESMKHLEERGITYAKGFDKICLIVDRDKESFTEEQYDFVLQNCLKNSFGLYVSNPCFEFWLLLHFEKVHFLNKEKLFHNKKVSNTSRYAESELKKLLPKYKKTKYDALSLVKQIDTAIANEAKFCEDCHQLKQHVGSNIGLLIQELRQ